MNGQQFLINMQNHFDAIATNVSSLEDAIEQRAYSRRPQILAIDSNTPDDDDMFLGDTSLLSLAPVAVVPKYSAFSPLANNGHRFLLAADGMYLEVRRPWLYVVHRLVEQTAVTMPFGEIEPCTQLAFGRISHIVPQIQQFAASAIRELPNEHADMLVWNQTDKTLSDLNVAISHATPGSLTYEARALMDHESLAVDIHSHGAAPAFFSDTDNQDDAGSVKLSAVIGDLDKVQPSIAVRLCLLGLYLPIPVPADKVFAGLEAL
ncbi:PRTRC system protein A [Collimonas sp. H4R21]|uniref:PRTRC system protein A n=1 Tax=Collimonas rhizosphaerae TaxID=3126357 RepID=A0ABU9PXS4_9BURK